MEWSCEFYLIQYPRVHLKSIFTCCNCRMSQSRDLSAYFQVSLISIFTRKRAVFRIRNFQTITL